MDAEESKDYAAVLKTFTELSDWIKQVTETDWEDIETFHVLFRSIDRICREFLDSEQPTFTDTLVRAEKILMLAGTESEFGDVVKSQCIRQEAIFMNNEVKRILSSYKVEDQTEGSSRIGRWFRRLWH